MNLTFRDSAGIVGGVTEDNARPLGAWLRQRREELGISLEQAEADTRIRTNYLEALETENFELLPDPIVGRGFLRNYAVYLELDLQEASARYTQIVAPSEPEPPPSSESSPFLGPFRPVPLHNVPGRSSRRGVLIILAVILGIAIALLTWWAYPYAIEFISQIWPTAMPVAASPTKMAPSVELSTATYTPAATAAATSPPKTTTSAETTAPTLTPTLTPTFTPTFTPSPSLTPSPPVYTGIFLELFFLDTSWVQVTVDGVRQFQGELETDTYRSWYGEDRIELRIGNAGGVEVTINGQKLGPLGAPGEVIDRVFEKMDDQITEATVTSTPSGDLTAEPTAEPTLEPTVPPSTPTLSPTATLTPTATITPTANP